MITADDPPQYARVVAFLEAHRTAPGEPPGLYVSPLAACELAWVLRRTYGRSRSEVLDALEGLLTSRDLVVGDREAIQAATAGCRAGRGEFVDFYLRESCLRAGCTAVATFEKRLAREQGFRPV